MGLAIVAIPEEQDRVWKFSSEKVPHLTLLFLGDEASADTQQIVQFVEHATQLSEHGPFYLDVESRGELGEDKADVLFFSKRSWNLKWIKQFRGQLLQNDAVRTAYDSAEQFGAPQDWVPHLTMGYPETPAKPVPDDGFGHPFYSVCFDRIAVWLGDFDGPEFKLEWPDREFEGDLAVAWADERKKALTHELMQAPTQPEVPEVETKEEEEQVLEQTGIEGETVLKGADFVSFLVHGIPEDGEAFILEHYGVKGMRWGQRNASGERGGLRGRSDKRKVALADRKERGVPAKGTVRGANSKREPEAVAPAAKSRVPQGNRRKTQIKTEGGQNHPAHEDAIKVAEAKAKLKKSGPAALSNKELQEVQTRLNLERNVSGLVSSNNRVARGRKFVKGLTGNVQEVNNTVNTGLQSARLAEQLKNR